MVAGMDEVINPGLVADRPDRVQVKVDVEIAESQGADDTHPYAQRGKNDSQPLWHSSPDLVTNARLLKRTIWHMVYERYLCKVF